jgi:hypothetical protein
MNNFRANWLPYVLVKVDDNQGGWIPLNRHYKPLGHGSRAHVDYSTVPVTSRIKVIRSSTAKALSWSGAGAVGDGGMIFLYNDSCTPDASASNWRRYEEKLSLLASLKTYY